MAEFWTHYGLPTFLIVAHSVTMIVALLIVNGMSLAVTALFTYESIREQEPRAPKIGLIGITLHLILGALILWVPAIRVPVAVGFGLCTLAGLCFLIPGRSHSRSLKGALGYADGEVRRFDERDIMFARAKLQPGTPEYESYYKLHPEHEEKDAQTRAKPGLLSPQAQP